MLVLLALTHQALGARFPRVYPWSMALVAVPSFATCVTSLAAVFGGAIPWLDGLLHMLPLYAMQLGWVVPAVLGVLIGVAHSIAERRRAAH